MPIAHLDIARSHISILQTGYLTKVFLCTAYFKYIFANEIALFGEINLVARVP